MVATTVVRSNLGSKISKKLGLRNAPDFFLSSQTADSGTKGKRIAIGIAGSKPVIKVKRQAGLVGSPTGRLGSILFATI